MAIGTGAALAIGAGANILGNVLGAREGAAAQDRAASLQRQAQERLAAIGLPEFEEYTPELLEVLGQLDPELEQEIRQNQSELSNIQVDPRLQAEQMSALEMLSGLSEGGLSEADLAGLEKARRGASQQAQAQQASILQNMQQRGLGGSGAELIARLQAGDAAADRELDANLDIAQLAQARALQALGQRAGLAGQIRSQEFGEQERVAQARDAINQFNTQLEAQRQARNAGAQNQAQQANLNLRQETANRNVGILNDAQIQRNQQLQQQFQNQMARAGGQNQITQQQAGLELERGRSQAGLYSGIANAVGGGLAAGAQMGLFGGSSTPAGTVASTTPVSSGGGVGQKMSGGIF